MGKKQKIFGCSLDNLVKRAEQELKKSNTSTINLDESSKSIKRKPITIWNIEGIFRKNSSVKDLTKAKKIIEEEGMLNLEKYERKDAILVSGLFKNFLAEMQGRVIPYKIYTKLKESKSDAEIKDILKELSINHYETLNYINQFVLILNDHCETNYMNLANLSIVIGPNLFELTNDEMINLNITVESSEIYKNILRIRKTERE
ncbi:hypothetical protein PIROE2DRAFT_2562 [Piromyces sp. E2]|nr:hypothetical protein PIROE2DRAFT_2562 [Piromyces sp. E2]|eukprot:OUM69474.1 hypothetical protein PIROE2DRAFT_2562 [Piromyces sp. E2]